jgi:hypothetical protein
MVMGFAPDHGHGLAFPFVSKTSFACSPRATSTTAVTSTHGMPSSAFHREGPIRPPAEVAPGMVTWIVPDEPAWNAGTVFSGPSFPSLTVRGPVPLSLWAGTSPAAKLRRKARCRSPGCCFVQPLSRKAAVVKFATLKLCLWVASRGAAQMGGPPGSVAGEHSSRIRPSSRRRGLCV